MSEPTIEILPAETEYPLLDDPSGVLELLDEGMAGRPLPLLDLQRIRVPSGGGLAFRYDTAAGEETAKKLTGVIVAWRQARIFWRARGSGKKPPDCTSTDGFTGTGDPGGLCSKCPYSKFGTAVKQDGTPGAGQACKDIRQALVLLPGDVLPHLLNVPPSSIKIFDQYSLTLMSARARYWGATTEFTLEKASSEDKIDYAKIIFRLGKRFMDEKTLAAFHPFHQKMKASLTPAIVDASAYEIEEGSASRVVDGERLVSAPRPRIAAPAPPAEEPAQREPGDDENEDKIPF